MGGNASRRHPVGALLLAAIGLYGLLAFSVAERRREIALRVALGAEPPAILRMVVGRGLKLWPLGLRWARWRPSASRVC